VDLTELNSVSVGLLSFWRPRGAVDRTPIFVCVQLPELLTSLGLRPPSSTLHS
jgi:hypothetical protein